MSTDQDQALAGVKRATEQLRDAETAAARAGKMQREAIRAAVAAGVSSGAIAAVAGVSAGRVSQIAPRAEHAPPRVHARKQRVEPVRVTVPDTVPALPAPDVATLSGIVSQRRRTPYGRLTAFYGVDSGRLVTEQGDTTWAATGVQVGSVAHVLQAVGAAGKPIGRVYLTGPAPADLSTGATMAEAVRAWALGEPPAGWRVADQGHYLHDPSKPVLRFTDDHGRRVTIMRAASWWGETDASPETCADAWRGLGRLLDAVPAFRGSGIADTPATTGKALWLRTIPEGKGFPVLSDEYRALIQSTSGQGRIELRPAPAGVEPADFTYLDGRFMYAALTSGMPVGEPRRWTGAELDALDAETFRRTIRGRGRWRITVTVPEGWEHVGLFMAPDGAGGWRYPSKPGETFTTWADGSEVWTGLTAVPSWEPVFHEGITWEEGKPLDAWRKGLVDAWTSARTGAENGHESARLAAAALRSILLFGLGAFASRTHNLTGSCPADEPERVPETAIPGTVTRVGDSLVWETPGTIAGWSAETAHPEWSATVWARARVRLLTGRGAGEQMTGALHLPPERIVAFATDALYVAGGEPEWADDGKPGRFRVKGLRPGAFAWPTDRAALLALRDDSERNAQA